MAAGCNRQAVGDRGFRGASRVNGHGRKTRSSNMPSEDIEAINELRDRDTAAAKAGDVSTLMPFRWSGDARVVPAFYYST